MSLVADKPTYTYVVFFLGSALWLAALCSRRDCLLSRHFSSPFSPLTLAVFCTYSLSTFSLVSTTAPTLPRTSTQRNFPAPTNDGNNICLTEVARYLAVQPTCGTEGKGQQRINCASADPPPLESTAAVTSTILHPLMHLVFFFSKSIELFLYFVCIHLRVAYRCCILNCFPTD